MKAFSFEQLEGPAGLATATSAAQRAAELIRLATAEADAIRERAAAAGREEGFAAGLAEARERLSPGVEAMARAAAAVHETVDGFLETAERRAVELALLLAEKVVGEALAAEPSLVHATVAGALRAAGERDRLLVEVHPADFELIGDAVDELSARVGGIRQLEVVAERRVPRGGCIVRTAYGEVDGRIAEKLALARDVLADARAGGADELPADARGGGGADA